MPQKKRGRRENMGRLITKCELENLHRSARLRSKCENPDASSLQGLQGSQEVEGGKSGFECFEESPASEKQELQAVLSSSGSQTRVTPLRRSQRLKGNVEDPVPSSPQEIEESVVEEKDDEMKGVTSAKCYYEILREARILENKARMALLGVKQKASALHAIISSNQSAKRSSSSLKAHKTVATPLRRSERLRGNSASVEEKKDCVLVPAVKKLFSVHRGSKGRGSAGLSGSRGRTTIYNPVLGICCHFCRQKTLCWEEDCKRCRVGDIDEPCTGKTECSACHSSNGVLCRACLKIRYGEEMEEVQRNKQWMCPHCTEEKGINPFWICNSSFCLKKRKMVPTGIAIYHARKMGYKSVAHLIMDKLKNESGLILTS